MKKTLIVLVLVASAAVGFVAGRLTANPAASTVASGAAAKNDGVTLPIPPRDAAQKPDAMVEPSANIVVETPAEGALLSFSFDVAGRARNDIGEVTITVKDEAGAVLADAKVPVARDAVGNFGRFSQSFALPASQKGKGTVEIAYDLAGNKMTADLRNVVFAEPDSVPIQVFFGTLENGGQDCQAVESVTRVVSAKGSVYRLAIEELLKGPTSAEKAAGYLTSLPAGAELAAIAADAAGTVTADFKPSLERAVGGSCRVAAIRAQIVRTLKQFPEVRDVVVSIDGRTEDILQP